MVALSSTGGLLPLLSATLDCPGFLDNGGRLGFPCHHAYPNSLYEGVTQQVGAGASAQLRAAARLPCPAAPGQLPALPSGDHLLTSVID